MEGIRDTLCSRDLSVDVASDVMHWLGLNWLSFVMTAEPAVDTLAYYFSKAQIEAGFYLVASIKMVPSWCQWFC